MSFRGTGSGIDDQVALMDERMRALERGRLQLTRNVGAGTTTIVEGDGGGGGTGLPEIFSGTWADRPIPGVPNTLYRVTDQNNRVCVNIGEGGGSAEVDPGSVPGLVAWWKADAIVGLNDGDPVATWEDSGANNYDQEQPTAGYRPIYVASEPLAGDLPVVRFGDPDTQFMQRAFAAPLARPFTWFVVGRFRDNFGVHALMGRLPAAGHPGTASDGMQLGHNFFRSSYMYNGGDFPFQPAVGQGAGDFHQFCCRWQGPDAVTFHVDGGASVVGDPDGAGYDLTLDGVCLAMRTSGNPSDVDVAEVIVFSGDVSDADRNGITKYLQAKWDLPPPLLWKDMSLGPDEFNALDFDCDPYGNIDARRPFQQVVDTASDAGGNVFIPGGHYIVGAPGIDMTQHVGVHLIGDGWTSTALEYTGASGILLTMDSCSTNIIAKLGFRASHADWGNDEADVLVRCETVGPDCIFLTFDECDFHGPPATDHPQGVGLKINRVIISVIRKCNFTRFQWGIRVGGSYVVEVSIEDCMFKARPAPPIEGNGGIYLNGAPMESILIQSNTFEPGEEGYGTGVAVGPICEFVYGLQVLNNWFGDTSQGVGVQFAARGGVISGNRFFYYSKCVEIVNTLNIGLVIANNLMQGDVGVDIVGSVGALAVFGNVSDFEETLLVGNVLARHFIVTGSYVNTPDLRVAHSGAFGFPAHVPGTVVTIGATSGDDTTLINRPSPAIFHDGFSGGSGDLYFQPATDGLREMRFRASPDPLLVPEIIMRINGNGVAFNGNLPIAKAAAIDSPSADVTSLKTAVDLLRAAVTNIGITA